MTSPNPNKILSNLVAVHFAFLYAMSAIIKNGTQAAVYLAIALWVMISFYGTFRLYKAFAARKALQIKSKYPAYIGYAFCAPPYFTRGTLCLAFLGCESVRLGLYIRGDFYNLRHKDHECGSLFSLLLLPVIAWLAVDRVGTPIVIEWQLYQPH
ncbi:hypothetical protein P4S72_20240 [Vibrio sp. PP-XX7]